MSWKLFAVIVPVFLVIDLLWLGILMKSFYSRELGDLARREGASISPRWGAALPIYLLIPAGLVLFVRPRHGHHATVWQAFGWGCLFGLVLYGMYGLTNLSVLARWTVRLTLADTAWGCVLCGMMSVLMRSVDLRLRH
ncbi:MAG TPA: DUF2177 family protein [Pirellulales bacterium]|nr:DUF2177 family protein [Pirellulales bacterium]